MEISGYFGLEPCTFGKPESKPFRFILQIPIEVYSLIFLKISPLTQTVEVELNDVGYAKGNNATIFYDSDSVIESGLSIPWTDSVFHFFSKVGRSFKEFSSQRGL